MGAAGGARFQSEAVVRGQDRVHSEVFEAAAAEVLAAIDNIHGHGRKLLILRSDDTLWGGTVGRSRLGEPETRRP